MKKTLVIAMVATCLYSVARAQSVDPLMPLEPTYIGSYDRGCDWGSNWFITVQGGVSAFAGKPVGEGDLFDRMNPEVSGDFGKWLSSAWGMRAVYDGFKFTDSKLEKISYNNIHADLMCNLTNKIGIDDRGISRWDLIPYVGIGSIMNVDGDKHPFAFSYGVMGRYHLGSGIHIVIEVGGTTTFADFDCIGQANAIGDNLLRASAGFSFTLGRKGWRRIVDAEPYMAENEVFRRDLRIYDEMRQRDQKIISEYRKILELEGLLAKYGLEGDSANVITNGKNRYSGIISLRKRIEERKNAGSTDFKDNNEEYNLLQDLTITGEKDGETVILSVPVFVFFKLGTTELTDRSQLINLDEIARIAAKYNLFINVSGAADNTTGTEEINNRLSMQRTEYIVEELKSRNVPEEHIVRNAEGGINRYEKAEANRNSMINLVFKK